MGHSRDMGPASIHPFHLSSTQQASKQEVGKIFNDLGLSFALLRAPWLLTVGVTLSHTGRIHRMDKGT